jgi:hypothetical protein
MSKEEEDDEETATAGIEGFDFGFLATIND